MPEDRQRARRPHQEREVAATVKVWGSKRNEATVPHLAGELESSPVSRFRQRTGADAVTPFAAVRRLGEILRIICHHPAALRVLRGRFDQKGVSALRECLVELGPTYVKLGQLIASIPGLFPPNLSEECRNLFCNVASLPPSEMSEVIRTELRGLPEEVFDQFNPQPLAAGSIAQVHDARLCDGRRVAVKIQRPGIARMIRADLRLLSRVARLLERYSSRARAANPTGVVDDLRASLQTELEFRREAGAMEEFRCCLHASGFDDGVRTPAVEWSHTTRRVLTMEYIEGHSFDELKTSGNWGNQPSELLRKVASAWLVTGLRYGIVHGDLHAGNLMVDRDGRVVFLDFGITARLDTQRRQMIRDALVAAIALSDFEPMARLLCERDGPTSIDLGRVGTELAATLKPALAQPLAEISPGQVLGALVEIGSRTGVKMPRDLIVLAKQLLYFEHYATSMAPQWSLFGELDLLAALFEATPGNESGMPSDGASSKTHIDSPDARVAA
jgi:predicted unusual protein kinase regulating ubiquinone biosynthesis (AarF/ABC1/UbiB family)